MIKTKLGRNNHMPQVRQAVHIAELFSVNHHEYSVQSGQSQATFMPPHREWDIRIGRGLD
jgi:hypothetical protein